MRIHIHNMPGGSLDPVSPEDWIAGGGRGEVSFGDDVSAYRQAGQIDVLLSATLALGDLFPLNANGLKIVSCMSAGLNMLAPFDWLPPRVALLNNSGAHAEKAAEFALMALLMIANDMPHQAGRQRARSWAPSRPRSLSGARMTVVGLGAIGQACARVARQAGMIVTGVRRSPGAHPDCVAVIGSDALDRLLPATDYLLLTTPLTTATRNLIDARRLALLPSGAGVINIGRGGILDETALCAALAQKHLAGAVLDVFEREPIERDSHLWDTPNLVVTPHMSSDDPARHNRRTVEILMSNITAFEAGLPMPNEFDTVTGTRKAVQ